MQFSTSLSLQEGNCFFLSCCTIKYCQNPNITTTQPNLNIGLGLTRLLLFTPTIHPTHPGTLLLLEKFNPRDLKFYMRPHLTKLTTTQHNSKTIISWGRGSPTLPPWLTLSNLIWTKTLFGQLTTILDNFNPTIFWWGRGYQLSPQG